MEVEEEEGINITWSRGRTTPVNFMQRVIVHLELPKGRVRICQTERKFWTNVTSKKLKRHNNPGLGAADFSQGAVKFFRTRRELTWLFIYLSFARCWMRLNRHHASGNLWLRCSDVSLSDSVKYLGK